jgi:hypothetical protein
MKTLPFSFVTDIFQEIQGIPLHKIMDEIHLTQLLLERG